MMNNAGTLGVYDYDFFTYENVIPNLECAKLVTYYRAHNKITVLTPTFTPSRYTDFIIRKEYNDGIFPKECFLPNVTYGGRAFVPGAYDPLPRPIEQTIPDMHIYDRYIDHFGRKPAELTQIKRILNCAHMRLAPDSVHLLSFESLKPYFYKGISGIFLHDYDLAKLQAYDLILALQNQRKFITRHGINPYPVGNKYPIKVYDSNELAQWLKIVTIPNAFCLEYKGLIADDVLSALCRENQRMARQIYYNIAYGCSSEDDFFINRLPKIFIQALFLRRQGIKILLKYDEGFFITPELEKFIELLNCWLSFKWQEDFIPRRQTLYQFCASNKRLHYINWAFQNVTVSTEESRDIFQYIREHNYNLFKMFYELDSIIFEGGKLVDEWRRDPQKD